MTHPDAPEALFAWCLAGHAADGGLTAAILRSDTRLERVARACAGFCAGRVELLVLPPWDVLPYDRVAPSAGIVGQRVRTLRRLVEPASLPRLLLTSADAALQRVPPPRSWDAAPLTLGIGDAIDPELLRADLGARGYHLCATVGEPGEVALHGLVLDMYPAADAAPVRATLTEGRIAALHRFDPLTQRNLEPVDRVVLHAAIEFPLDPAEAAHAIEQDATPLAAPPSELVPLMDYLGEARFVLDAEVEQRWAGLRELAQDAHDSTRRLARAGLGGGVLPAPDRLYLSPEQAARSAQPRIEVRPEGAAEPTPRRIAQLMHRVAAAAGPVVIATPDHPAALARSLARKGFAARAAETWADATSGGVACLALDIDHGFAAGDLLVVQAAALLRGHAPREAAALGLQAELAVGDVVVHVEHGAARLAGLKPVEADGMAEERVALAFADDAELLVPVEELDRVWRYGATGALDRLGGDAWQRRRAEIEAEIAAVAAQLAEQAAARAARRAPAMAPERAALDRIARRFAHAPSPDQRAAVDAVLDDLARGAPPMERLVCGDVGFGKTEVALRAAAAVALAGWQVAVLAPTTVLARQHLDTFRRRFAGTAIRVEPVMAATDAAARRIRADIAAGAVGIAVGTQALASDSIRFARLGLVIVDEEQRFGEAQKQSLARDGVHLLAMTATPIPRTLQSALVGLREVSVIATPPARRQPTRTFVVGFDRALLREALLREHARGGQSFVVCPRIADLGSMATLLAELAPELAVVQAHGRMKPAALEAAVLGFAHGEGDVLLATDIIESGLDIPRANTIVIQHADRFGLAQLHQMRGRVGRGARRGAAYLMTDPGRRLAAATRARLQAMGTLANLGAGAAISAADLDQRGAGDLFGSAQAGHVSALGTELYQHLLLAALAARRGEPGPAVAPVLHVGLGGRIPEAMVPEPELRLGLYRRLARLASAAELDDFAHELADRFGELPHPAEALLLLARLRIAAAAHGIRRIEAGPRGAALTLAEGAPPPAGLAGEMRDGRFLLPAPGAGAAGRVGALVALLEQP